METNYNKLLYEKMQAENETFKDWLLSQEPAEILNHAYEYTIYQDMMLCMEDMDLSPKQAKAMYQSPRTISEKVILRKLNVIVGFCIWKKDVSHRKLLLCSNCNGFCNTNEDN